MRNIFDFCCEHLNSRRRADEHHLLWFEGEQSDFVRFNHANVRQAGTVNQATIEVRLIQGKKHIAGKQGLSGDPILDKGTLDSLLNSLRMQLPDIPEDPYLLYSEDKASTESIQKGILPSNTELIAQIADSAKAKDLVGIYAAGPICRGFASSFGSRRWHQTETFNWDFSLYLSGDKAVKSRYAGFEWQEQEYLNKIQHAIHEMEILARPSITLAPGKYRVYLAPTALAEIISMLAWDSFGIKAQKTQRSALLRLIEGFDSFHPLLNIQENVHGGISPNFDANGFAKPDNFARRIRKLLKNSFVNPMIYFHI